MSVRPLIAQRLRSTRLQRGFSARELSELTQTIKQTRLSNWEAGRRTPGPDEILLLARHLECSPAYLMGLEDDDGETTEVRDQRPAYSDYALLPRGEVTLPDGQDLRSEQITDDVAIHDSTLKMLGVSRPACVRCSGDAMAPTLSDGDRALLDLDAVTGEGVFALATPAQGLCTSIVLRRLRLRMDGAVDVVCDNSDQDRYPESRLADGIEAAGVQVIGKVVWAIRRIH